MVGKIHPYVRRRYLVSNDTMSTVSKFNKCEIHQQKIITPQKNERHMLVSSYFYTYVFHLLGFDTDNMVSFDTLYFFLCERESVYSRSIQ